MKEHKCAICRNKFMVGAGEFVENDTEGSPVCPACYSEAEGICGYCHRVLNRDEIESLEVDDNGDPMCDDCYSDHYQQICPICENYFDKATKAEDYRFAITKSVIDENNIEYNGKSMIPGIYRALRWPMYIANCVSGFEGFFDDSVELIKKHDFSGNHFCEEICHDCVEKSK